MCMYMLFTCVCLLIMCKMNMLCVQSVTLLCSMCASLACIVFLKCVLCVYVVCASVQLRILFVVGVLVVVHMCPVLFM